VLCVALSSAIPERIIGESGSAPTMRCIVSGQTESGRPFTSILFINGGMGARAASDGLPTTCFPSTVMAGAMEAVEAVSPVRIWRKEFAVDSGGPGRFRGGLGQDVEVEVLSARNATASFFVERTRYPARGVLGGRPGGSPGVAVNGKSDGIPLKGRIKVAGGDRIRLRYAGGGGYGDPRSREREMVRADLEAGIVSQEAAQKEYGLKCVDWRARM
jgi:N-methylhydantoinase B